MYGAKVSRQGFDVGEASDKQLAFSSQWPLLPIEAEGSKVLSADTSYDEVLYTHSLGYAPVFFVWEEKDSKLYSGGKTLVYNVYSTSTTLHLEDYIFDNCTLHWKVFRRSLLTNYTSSNLVTTDATEKDSADYGISVSLPTKDISNTDKRNFGVRSDVRQLMIHKTGYTGLTLTETVTHNLGYQPIYWLYTENTFRNPSGAYSLQPETGDFQINVSTTQLTWQFFGIDTLRFAYLIFKDPITADG